MHRRTTTDNPIRRIEFKYDNDTKNIYTSESCINSMDSNQVFNTRLSCRVDKTDGNLFFSLVNYRNNFFTSSDSEKIIEFYDQFENRDQLIEWMKERPKGTSYIHEADGNKSVIVVVTTADFEGKYAKACRDEVFKGLHIVFVESGGKEDFYFNYAHNCNVGIRRAMEYNPKWVIVSNDDMVKIDDITILLRELKMIDNSKTMTVFTYPSHYHSYNTCVGTRRFLITDFIYYMFYLSQKEGHLAWKMTRRTAKRHKYDLRWFIGPRNKLMRKLFLKRTYYYTMTSDFTILSSEFCKKKNEVFNEIYQNGIEDWELSIELSKLDKAVVNYKIGDMVGKTLGNSAPRAIRDLANNVYFNARIDILLSA